MYNFFSNQTKYRSFKKALKEVEKESFFENLVAEEDSVAVSQDMSKSVASLSGKRANEPKKVNDETLKATELESSLDKHKAVSGQERDRLSRYQSADDKGENQDYYRSLFRDDPTFLDDQETQSEPEFLDRESDYQSELDTKVDEYNELAQRIRDRREELARRKQELEQSNQIEPEMDMPVFAQEEQETPEAPKVTVEVVADIPEPEVKTITKTIIVEKEVQAPKPEPKKKTTTTTRKRKRKYDADISGGFNY